MPPEQQPDYDTVMAMSSRNPGALPIWEQRMGRLCAGQGGQGVRLVPEEGTCVLFWNHLPGARGGLGQLNRLSLHAGCDVVRGKKWIANVWIEADNDSQGTPAKVYRDEL